MPVHSSTMLTKNPLLAVKLGYLDLFQSLRKLAPDHPQQAEVTPPFQVQVSLAFWRDEARRSYDLAAPTVEERIAGVRGLRDAGVPVVLRIDPLFPRSPLPLNGVAGARANLPLVMVCTRSSVTNSRY